MPNDKLNILITETSRTNRRVRVELYESITKLGHNLFFIYRGNDEVTKSIDNCTELKMPITAPRNNSNPLKEMKLLFAERKLLRENKIDSTLIYGIRTIPRFVLASKLAGVGRVVCVVNGSGNLFMGKGIKKRILRFMAFPMIAIALRLADKVFFQNQDDYDLLIKLRLASKKNSDRVNGSGVNLEQYTPCPLNGNPSFLLITRLTGNKGVNEFVKAAGIVKSKYPNARFDLVGPEDDNDNNIDWNALHSAISQKIVYYHGRTDNVKKFISHASAFVFPSYYREGIPRSVLEAMAMGRPIITTSSPGCKETVVDGVNGFLITPKDVEELAKKMIWMIENHEILPEMGTRSRELCEKKFDVNKINQKILKELL